MFTQSHTAHLQRLPYKGSRDWGMGIFGGSIFQPVKGRSEVFLQLKCTKCNSEGEISLGADEKGDGGKRARSHFSTIAEAAPRLWPRRSQRPTQSAEVLTRTAAESEVMVRMTWASGADTRKTLSQALKQGPGPWETAGIGRPPVPSEQAPVPSPHLGGGGKMGRGQGRTPPAGQRHR